MNLCLPLEVFWSPCGGLLESFLSPCPSRRHVTEVFGFTLFSLFLKIFILLDILDPPSLVLDSWGEPVGSPEVRVGLDLRSNSE